MCRGHRVLDDADGAVDRGVDDADLAVTEVDEVLGSGAGPAPIVDVDAGDAWTRLLVDEDDGQLATQQPVTRR